jgi:hypothetical protein
VIKDLVIKNLAKKDHAKKDHVKKDLANGLALNHHVRENILVENKDGMKNHVKGLLSLGVWEEDIWDHHLVDLLDLDLISDLDHISDSEDLGADHLLDLEDLGENHHVKDGENLLVVVKNVMIKNVRKRKMKRKNQKLNKNLSLKIININIIIKRNIFI